MNVQERIAALVALGKLIQSGADEFLNATIKRTAIHNPWFTEANQQQALEAIAQQMLDAALLEKWLAPYPMEEPIAQKQVGLVLAGN
ncbi:MAG: acyl-CoA reductase, partial [Bacteroidota bacterium]